MAALLLRALAGVLLANLLLVGGAVALGTALPDGGEMIYTSLRVGASGIYRLDVSRGLARNLTPRYRVNLSSVWASDGAVWSPDGRQIAFVAARGGGSQLFVMDADGRSVRGYAAEFQADGRPAWSPDGRRIAFRVIVNGSPKIAVLPLDTGEAYVVNVTSAADSAAVWSPDGRWVLFLSFRDGNPRMYVVDPDCRDRPRGCRYNDVLLLSGVSSGWPPSWSPDGRQMAFMRLFTGNAELYTVELRCTTAPDTCARGMRRLTDNQVNDRSPSWSPDGKSIAFISNREGAPDLYLMDAATGETRRLTHLGLRGQVPAWSPDGQYIAVESELAQGGSATIYLVHVASGAAQRLTVRGIANAHAAWRPALR